MKAYQYDAETKQVVKVVNYNNQEQLDNYIKSIDTDIYGVTHSPAFGTIDGLVMSNSVDEIFLDCANA